MPLHRHRRRIEAAHGRTDLRHLRRGRRAGLPRARAGRRWPRALAERRRRARARRRAPSTRRTEAAARRPHRRLPRRRHRRRVQAGRARPEPPAARRQPARLGVQLDERAAPDLRAGSPTLTVSTPRPGRSDRRIVAAGGRGLGSRGDVGMSSGQRPSSGRRASRLRRRRRARAVRPGRRRCSARRARRCCVVHPPRWRGGRARPRSSCAAPVSRSFTRPTCRTPRPPRPPRSPPVCGRSSARPTSPARTPWSASAAGTSPTSPASSPRPGCAGCRSCRCRRRCSAWSTPRSAARPASTPPRARTWSARSTRRPRCSCDLDAPGHAAARTTSSPGSPRSSRPASSPTRRSSTSSRPTRRRPLDRDGAARSAELIERAIAVKAEVVAEDLTRVRAARDPQLRPHPRPRDRAGRALPLAARRGGLGRHGVRRRAAPARRPAERRRRRPAPRGAAARSGCRPPTRRARCDALLATMRRDKKTRGATCCGSSCSTTSAAPCGSRARRGLLRGAFDAITG